MIAKKILTQLPEMARLMHFAMNNHRVQGNDYVHNFVRDFPKPELQKWHTTMPVLSACWFLKMWFKDHCPNSVFYEGGFTNKEILVASTRDFIRTHIQAKVKDLIKAGDTIQASDPFQGVISDTILALNWAMGLIDAVESGHFINWHTLEVKTEIEF